MLTSNVRELIRLIAAELPAASTLPNADGLPNATPETLIDGVSSFPETKRNTTAAESPLEIGRLIAELSGDRSIQDATPLPIPARSKARVTSGGFIDDVGKTLLSGFGVVSLFRGLLGGGEQTEETPLPRFELPPAINAALALDGRTGEFAPAEYTAAGLPRAASGTTQITVNVNALDSRSFMDHSADIARAVREAMLNSHSLNDLIAEL